MVAALSDNFPSTGSQYTHPAGLDLGGQHRSFAQADPRQGGSQRLVRHQTRYFAQEAHPHSSRDMDVTQPGFMEADTVAHCGDSLAGDFVWSLTMTDICTGWTECRTT